MDETGAGRRAGVRVRGTEDPASHGLAPGSIAIPGTTEATQEAENGQCGPGLPRKEVRPQRNHEGMEVLKTDWSAEFSWLSIYSVWETVCKDASSEGGWGGGT